MGWTWPQYGHLLSAATMRNGAYLVRVLRWDKKVADDIITAIDALQLRSGFVTPVLEDVSTPIMHAGKGWILQKAWSSSSSGYSFKIE